MRPMVKRKGDPDVWPARTSVGPRILLAESDEALRKLLVVTLARDGYDVIAATSGEDAVTILTSILAHDAQGIARNLVVLTDMRASGSSGARMGEMIRAAHVPVIFMTAESDPERHAEAQCVDAAAVLAKPFRLDYLRRVVLSTLAAQVRSRRLELNAAAE